ncbi:MAG: TIGR00725 family protein [Candidatus Dadabacteria bacterium]|nr:TIGR00725 family protein [Candidatus Dadabacteria bacterium]
MGIIIGVIGAGNASDEEKRISQEVGVLIAESNCLLLCGAMGGVMEATCRGAKSAGGTTIGILPGTKTSSVNRFIDIPIVTGMGEARNVIVAKSSHCIIAIGGGFGTLSEISFALKSQIPVIGLDTWDVSEDIIR